MKELNIIRNQLKAPKGQYNSFGGYKYRSCEDILEAVKPLLNDNSLVLSDEMVEVGGRIYVKATVTFTNKEGKSIQVCAFAREPESRKGQDDSQVTGAASSYARKYALNGLFCIDDAKDADTDEFAKKTGAAEKKAPANKGFKKPVSKKVVTKSKVSKSATLDNSKEKKQDNNDDEDDLF